LFSIHLLRENFKNMPVTIRWRLLGLAMLFLPWSGASADVIAIAAMKDTTLYENNTSNSNGMGLYLFAGQTIRDFGVRRALIAFDIAAAVPAGARINAVALQLTVSKNPGAEAISLALHRLTADWGEGASVAPSLGGDGVAAEAGDATWLHTFFDSGFWLSGGGDFVTTPSATLLIAGNADYCWESSSTQQDNAVLVDDVQLWLDNPEQNFGWILKNDENAPATSARRFNSRENSDASPQLFISFTPASSSLIFQDGFEPDENNGCAAS
jgi:hypothetical protein